MTARRPRTTALVAVLVGATGVSGCPRRVHREPPPSLPAGAASSGAGGRSSERLPSRPPRAPLSPLGPDEVYVYAGGTDTTAKKMTTAEARAAGLLVVDLSDGWAPYIFQDGGADKGDPAKPNGYRQTFIDLANDRSDADGRPLAGGEHNFLEPFGIPPTLSVLSARVEDDVSPARTACRQAVPVEGLRAWTETVGYLDRERARREHAEVLRDGDWLPKEIARREQALAAAERAPAAGTAGASGAGVPAPTGVVRPDRGARTMATSGKGPAAAVPPPLATWKPGDRAAAISALVKDPDPTVRARVERLMRGQGRERAVVAAQALLTYDGLLAARARATPGSFDLATHEALAAWERKNDVFGWGMLGGETQAGLLRAPLELDHETFKRIASERVADAAGIVEDGSTARQNVAATYVDADGAHHAVPNVIEEHVTALLSAMHVADAGDLPGFLRQHGPEGFATLKVAFAAPALPPYYPTAAEGPRMTLSAEIDRGDVWYDFPFNAKGRPIEQPRTHYPHLTLFAHWHGQRIPLVAWRTTIGSWRSELHANGKVYYKYKNSDVGPKLWRDIVAGPVWIPPDGTPVKDLLVRKVLDRNRGPELVVNTDVMGPGFQSAYGLVMAIHIDRSGFDNQIRTHGSVDYTSIARRFSHGCHRLVNDRAVRMFDFLLRHSSFRRVGAVPLQLKRRFEVDGRAYDYGFATRGYYYQLKDPIPVEVVEGRVMGVVKKPITAYVRKAGVDYADADEGDGAAAVALGDPRARAAAEARGRARGERAPDPSTGDSAASVKDLGGSRAPEDEGPAEPEPALGP